VTADIRGNLIGVYANVANIIAIEGNVGNTRFLGGNMEVSGQVNVLGNVVAPFFFGNGSQLTGVTTTLPTIMTADIRGNLIGVYANVSDIIAVEGNVGNTRFLGGNVAVSGQINALGNIVAPFFIGNGSLLTGITSTLLGTATIDIRGNQIGAYSNVDNTISNIATISSAGNGNVLTVQSTTLNTTGALIQGTSLRGAVNVYSMLRLDNAAGRVLDIDGRGLITTTTTTNNDCIDVRATSGTYTSDVLNLQTTVAAASTFNFIRCTTSAGVTTPFTVNGKGDVETTGDITCGNTVSIACVSNANVLTVTSSTANYTNSLVQLSTSRGALSTYSFLRCDNSVGRVLDVNGQGTITTTVQVNAPGMSITQTGGTMTNDMLRIATTAVAGGSQYSMICAKNASGNVFRVNGLGTVFGTGAYNTTGADYAEMFEWEDGNTNDEDRRGTTVVVGNGGMIHIASQNDNPVDVIGVVSVNPSVLGDTRWNEWGGRYLRDKFGTKLSNTLYYIANVSNENERVRCDLADTPPTGYEKVTSSEYVANPNYDPTDEYISRENRPEWSPIGLIGKLRVLPDQIVNPGWKLLRTIKHVDGNTLEYLVK
jgi:hypothetical protein